MRIKDDFKNLMERFEKESNKKGKIDLLDLFKESLKLFEKLKDTLATCSKEEKKQVFEVMAEMHQFLLQETRKIAERTGMSEEQLLRFAENPDNFSASQWKALEVIKIKLDETAKDLSHLVRKDTPEAIPDKKDKSSTGPKRPKSSKKDRWMRS